MNHAIAAKATSFSAACYGGSGIDFLHGREGTDTLFGGKGNDKLYGQEGADRLSGQEGNDLMDCGDENDRSMDVIVFRSHYGQDEVHDFRVEDRIDVVGPITVSGIEFGSDQGRLEWFTLTQGAATVRVDGDFLPVFSSTSAAKAYIEDVFFI